MSIGLIDANKHYRLPDCMRRSSFVQFFGVFKLEQEQLKMERAECTGRSFSIRTEEYRFEEKWEEVKEDNQKDGD